MIFRVTLMKIKIRKYIKFLFFNIKTKTFLNFQCVLNFKIFVKKFKNFTKKLNFQFKKTVFKKNATLRF